MCLKGLARQSWTMTIVQLKSFALECLTVPHVSQRSSSMLLYTLDSLDSWFSILHQEWHTHKSQWRCKASLILFALIRMKWSRLHFQISLVSRAWIWPFTLLFKQSGEQAALFQFKKTKFIILTSTDLSQLQDRLSNKVRVQYLTTHYFPWLISPLSNVKYITKQ